MNTGYHYTVKPAKCSMCRRLLRRGEYYHGTFGNSRFEDPGHIPRLVVCLPCRNEVRCFTQQAASEIIGISHTLVSRYANAGGISGLRRAGRGRRMVPLPWILEQKKERQQRQTQAA